MSILKRGMSGEPVRMLQEKLGLKADGSFGPRTEDALEAWQKSNGLKVDGIAGPDTFAAMGLYQLILLRQGTSGDSVRKMQTALGIKADGKFGPGTEKAVRAYQQKMGLVADGMAGPRTLAKMQLFAQLTPDIVDMAFVPPELTVPGGLPPLPEAVPVELPGATVNPGTTPATADASATGEKKSVWETVKGWFS
jgi:peptidoglycan hydrolase-like protein with peptidoglycan-binding domain